MDDSRLARAKGCLVGLAVGDALGAGYEFQDPPEGDAEMIGGGLGNWAPGEWTDDTQMAICIAEVAASRSLYPAAVGDRFLEWYRSNPADVGIQTRAVLSRASSGADLKGVAAEYFADNPRGSAGNGSLMRTAPVALAHLGDDGAIVEAARGISALTHGDPLAGDACVLWCIAIDRAVREERLDGISDGLRYLEASEAALWTERIEEAQREPPGRFVPNGFVVRALQAAWSAIARAATDEDPGSRFTRTLHAAVQAGDDTDTVAAIAGSLVGAHAGVAQIPREWRDIIHGWPGYSASDLESLAETIVKSRKV